MTDNDLRARLRDLRPPDEDWAESDQGTALLQRVLREEAPARATAPRPRAPLRRVAVLVAAGCLAVATALGVAQFTGPGQQATPDRPVAGRLGFDSLPPLVADSEVIVVGKVAAVERGDGGCPTVPDKACTPWYLNLRVQEQLLGPTTGRTIDVLLHAAPSGNPQKRFGPGDRLVLFLSGNLDGHYRPVALTGQWHITADGRVRAPAGDPLSKSVEGDAWTAVKRRIEAAITAQSGREVGDQPERGVELRAHKGTCRTGTRGIGGFEQW